MKKIKYYRHYAIIPGKNKNSKWSLYGFDDLNTKGIKILSLSSEDEIQKAKNHYQLRSNIYYELKQKIYRTVTDLKSNYNPAKIMLYNYDELVKDVILNVKSEYLAKQIHADNILNKSIQSSRSVK